MALGVTKQVLEDLSQQFALPFDAAGQLFWQSLSELHDVAHVPLPLELPDELLPPLEPFPASSPLTVPSAPLPESLANPE